MSSGPIHGWGTPAGQLRARRRADLIIEGARPARARDWLRHRPFHREVRLPRSGDCSGRHLRRVTRKSAGAESARAGQVTFLEKRFEDCDVDGPFDAVTGSSILHHLDIAGAVSNIRRLLKPGGILSFAEPKYVKSAGIPGAQVSSLYIRARSFPSARGSHTINANTARAGRPQKTMVCPTRPNSTERRAPFFPPRGTCPCPGQSALWSDPALLFPGV